MIEHHPDGVPIVEPLARRLQIRQGAAQQGTRLLGRQTIEVRLVELSQILIAEVHSGRSGCGAVSQGVVA